MARWIAIGPTVIFLGDGLFTPAAPYPWRLAIPGVFSPTLLTIGLAVRAFRREKVAS